MIEGLNQVLQGSELPGLLELRELLQTLVGGRDGAVRFIGQDMLQPRGQRVFRLRFGVNGATRSVVIKRLKPQIARRNELVAKRWLPAIGLSETGPPLLGSVAARSGGCVWHVYDDLGEHELNPREPDRERVSAAVELIAQMHTRFARHALLGEIRLHGSDLGIHFYEANVRDAIYALKALKPTAQRTALHDGLLERLYKLRAELSRRAHAMISWSGPETLLHGDLWAINVFVIPSALSPSPSFSSSKSQSDRERGRGGAGWHARLIDWDHAAVGPATYDLSTFLLRFPPQHRSWVLELYRQAVADAGWHLPDDRELNSLFETHEYARFANRLIWPAIALVMDRADWGWEELAGVERWFEQFDPVLPNQPNSRCEAIGANR